ncbi:MAG: GAF domain-containing protein [candidate division Zixibacteria bacterium]|nr:GAF domain-containing protein [candidate division Zixibacteria bacterium]
MDKNFQISKAKEVETVLKISQAVSRTLNLDEILEMSCRMTARALKADRCSIGLLYTKDVYEIIHTYRKKPSYPSIDGEKFKLADYTHIAQNLLQGKAFHLYDHKKIPLSIKERKLFKQLNLKVFLAVPIIVGKKPLGAFHLGRAEESTPFSSSDINLCQTIASQIGIAIKNATLVKELKENHQLLEKQSDDLKIRYQQQNLILDISKSLFQTLNLQELFDIITRKTCEAIKVDRCAISTFDAEQKQGVIRSIYLSRGAGSNGKSKHYSSYLGGKYTIADFPYIYKIVQKKKILVTENILTTPLTPRARKYYRDIGIKSTLILPLFSDSKMSGILQVSSIKNYRLFTDSEIKLCQTIANLTSMALENVKLMQELQEKSTSLQQQTEVLEKQYREQNILLEISKAVSQTLDLQKLFDIATETTAKLLNVERSTILFYDKAKKFATYKSAYIKGRHHREYVDRELKVSRYPTLANLLKKNLILSESDISESPFHPQDKKYFQKRGVISLLAASFSLGTGIAGIFSIGSHGRHIKFSDSEVRLCKSIANLLSVAIQNAMLMQDLQQKSLTIQKQSETLEKQFREQTILLEISKALSQTLDLKKLFEIVTQKTVELLGIDRAAAMMIDQKTGYFPLFIHFSRVKQPPELRIFPKSVKDFPYIIDQVRNGQLFCVSDVAKSSLTSKEKSYFRKRGIKSVLSVPFILRGRLLGVLGLNSIREKHEFTEPEIKLSRAIANLLSVAVENANLMEVSKKHSEELEKLSLQIINAQEEEKKNLAGKLHDVIAQDLTALQLDLKMSQQELPEQFAQTRNRLKEGEGLARQALENVCNLTMDLRPPILDDFGLASAIRWYVDGFSRRTNIKVALKFQELDCKFPPEFETAIYRTIQECLTNVAKHSEANKVNVSLDKKNEHLRIIIRDNGIGFDPEIFHFTSGFGLFRLKEKTELLGGKFRISSRRGKGTRVVIIFPCKDKEKK